MVQQANGNVQTKGVSMKSTVDKSERRFNNILFLAAVLIVVLLLAILATLLVASIPAIKTFGLTFFWGTTWDAAAEKFGALPFLLGTLITSFMAIFICIPFSISISIFLGEYLKEGAFSAFLRSSIEVLAGIPSVIYGLWGLFLLMPIVRAIEMQLGVTPHGVGILTSALILAIMIIPFSASIGREVITLVPADLKEAAYSLGATRFEVIKNIIVPYARSGIIAGILLSLGRAIGETMAVTMLIGNSNSFPRAYLAPPTQWPLLSPMNLQRLLVLPQRPLFMSALCSFS